MTLRRLSTLQWSALLLGALAWAAQHVIGFGVTQAECGLGGRRWGIDNTVWQATTMGVTVALILAAQALAVLVYLRTSPSHYTDEPPESRIRFFAITAMPINTVVLFIVLLDGFASIFNEVCRQS